MTPLGMDMATTWDNLIAGKSGIDYITLFDATPHATKIAGEVKGFEPEKYINRKDVRRMDRFAQLAVAAGHEAVKNASLKIDSSNQDDIGVFVGSGIGGLGTLFEQAKILVEKGPDRVSPFLAPMMIADIAAAQISIALGVRGPNFCTTSACSSGSDAIGVAYELIKHGDTPVMFAGGAESIINPLGVTAFNSLKALSTRNEPPQKASRPFVTALSSPKEPSSSSWKAWNTPWAGAPISWRKSSVTGPPLTRFMLPSRWKTAPGRPERCRMP
jgi:3-oxoacyl-[acyl-carrier-protein] synthase II